MEKKGWLFLLLLFVSSMACASTVTCTGGQSAISFTLPASVLSNAINITAGLSGDNTTYRELYTWDYMHWGHSDARCRASANGVKLGWMEYAYSTSGKEPVLRGTDYVFPTEVDGIGISFYDSNVTHKSIGSYTSGALNRATWSLSTTDNWFDAYFYIKVKLWKIPGTFNPAQANASGMLEFNDIKVVQALQILTAGDSWVSGLPQTGPSPLSNSWTTNYVSLSGGINVYPGTCNFTDQIVDLGKYQRGNIPLNTPWKDISFTILCPPAWGHGATATMSKTTANTLNGSSIKTATKGIILTVYERTGIEDASRGIIKLRSGGAEGYGIQLAWGTAAAQPTTGDPTSANKVIFSQPKAITTTSYGNTGQTTSQLIQMAARYTRTTGDVKAGRADGAIEIVASYN